MWELILFMLSFGVFMLVMNYWVNPGKIFEDIKSLKGSTEKVEQLEQRINELETIVKTLTREKDKIS